MCSYASQSKGCKLLYYGNLRDDMDYFSASLKLFNWLRASLIRWVIPARSMTYIINMFITCFIIHKNHKLHDGSLWFNTIAQREQGNCYWLCDHPACNLTARTQRLKQWGQALLITMPATSPCPSPKSLQASLSPRYVNMLKPREKGSICSFFI